MESLPTKLVVGPPLICCVAAGCCSWVARRVFGRRQVFPTRQRFELVVSEQIISDRRNQEQFSDLSQAKRDEWTAARQETIFSAPPARPRAGRCRSRSKALSSATKQCELRPYPAKKRSKDGASSRHHPAGHTGAARQCGQKHGCQYDWRWVFHEALADDAFCCQMGFLLVLLR